jgi:hypothetical protein
VITDRVPADEQVLNYAQMSLLSCFSSSFRAHARTVRLGRKFPRYHVYGKAKLPSAVLSGPYRREKSAANLPGLGLYELTIGKAKGNSGQAASYH